MRFKNREDAAKQLAGRLAAYKGRLSSYAVGQFFEDFSEVTDDMVVTALSGAARAA
jgi:predicted phosphoribosyltransferase